MPRFEARHKVVERLKSLNLFEEAKDHEMVLPLCSRTGDVLEPLLKEQWFVKASKLFEICGKAVLDGSLELISESRVNLWNYYVNNFTTKDWCISRQLWWGQQIPAYKCSPIDKPDDSKWFSSHNQDQALRQAQKYFNTDKISIQQGAFRVRF
jgi:valyl-tRNA synthetase